MHLQTYASLNRIVSPRIIRNFRTGISDQELKANRLVKKKYRSAVYRKSVHCVLIFVAVFCKAKLILWDYGQSMVQS